MSIARHNVVPTEERMSGSTGLLVAQAAMENIGLAEAADRIFGAPGSNRGLPASAYVSSISLLMLKGGQRLEGMRDLASDEVLGPLGIEAVPSPEALGNFLQRHGRADGPGKVAALVGETALRRVMRRGDKLTVDMQCNGVAGAQGRSAVLVQGRAGLLDPGGDRCRDGDDSGGEHWQN